jgi:hypothetical protein
MGKPSDLVQGTLDLLIFKTISPRAQARLGHRQAHSADLERSPAGPAGLALPGAAPARAAGVDHGPLGGERNRPPGQVLLAHRDRQAQLEKETAQLEPALQAINIVVAEA